MVSNLRLLQKVKLLPLMAMNLDMHLCRFPTRRTSYLA